MQCVGNCSEVVKWMDQVCGVFVYEMCTTLFGCHIANELRIIARVLQLHSSDASVADAVVRLAHWSSFKIWPKIRLHTQCLSTQNDECVIFRNLT